MEEGFPEKYVLKAPIVIYLEISGKCNLKCDHCFIGEKPQKELSTSEWKEIITECAEMGVLVLGLAGGEPLIRKDFLQLLDHAISEGMKTIIIPTNGTVMLEGIFEYLEKADAKITFMVSLDSHRQEFHDELRGVDGTFQKVMNHLNEFLEAHQLCALSTVITKENCHDVMGIWEFIRNMGIKKWFLERVQPIGSARQSTREWELSEEEWGDTLRFLFREAYGKGVTLAFGDAFRSLFWLARNEPWFPQGLVRESPYPKCEAGKTSMTITATGDVITCAPWRKPIDSVKDHTLTEIWNENPFYQELRALRVDHIEVCKDCEEKTFCGGGCRGVAYEYSGSLYAPDPHCPKFLRR